MHLLVNLNLETDLPNSFHLMHEVHQVQKIKIVGHLYHTI